MATVKQRQNRVFAGAVGVFLVIAGWATHEVIQIVDSFRGTDSKSSNSAPQDPTSSAAPSPSSSPSVPSPSSSTAVTVPALPSASASASVAPSANGAGSVLSLPKTDPRWQRVFDGWSKMQTSVSEVASGDQGGVFVSSEGNVMPYGDLGNYVVPGAQATDWLGPIFNVMIYNNTVVVTFESGDTRVFGEHAEPVDVTCGRADVSVTKVAPITDDRGDLSGLTYTEASAGIIRDFGVSLNGSGPSC